MSLLASSSSRQTCRALSSLGLPEIIRISPPSLPGPSTRASQPPSNPPSSKASFSSSAIVRGHYDTLEVPRDASKAEIKASFYRLSKKYHPDVNREASARHKFHAVSDAWAVLGDDAARRDYDRNVNAHAYRPTHDQARESWHPSWAYGPDEPATRRRPGATYAWEARGPRTSRARPSRPSSSSSAYDSRTHQYNPRRSTANGFGPGGYQYDPRLDPWASSANVRRATGGQKNADDAREELDRIRAESGVVRFVQVLSLVVFFTFVGGWSAKA